MTLKISGATTLAVTVALAAALVGCQESTLKAGLRGQNEEALALKFCDVTLSYASVKPVFDGRCVRCHQSGTRNAVGTYGEIARIKDSIHFEITNDTMPDDGPLSAEQKKLMMAWLDAGAPESSSQVLACGQAMAEPAPTNPTPPPVAPTPAPPVDPVTPPTGPRTYAELRAKVLEPKCLTCHNIGGSAMLYDFTDYQSMISLNEIYDRANPANSVIVQAVLKVGRGQMPPVRSNIPRLTDDEVELLRGWIEDGMLE